VDRYRANDDRGRCWCKDQPVRFPDYRDAKRYHQAETEGGKESAKCGRVAMLWH
jgi:hypothetical protein